MSSSGIDAYWPRRTQPWQKRSIGKECASSKRFSPDVCASYRCMQVIVRTVMGMVMLVLILVNRFHLTVKAIHGAAAHLMAMAFKLNGGVSNAVPLTYDSHVPL